MSVFGDNSGTWVEAEHKYDETYYFDDGSVQMGGGLYIYYPTDEQISNEGYDPKATVYIRAIQLVYFPPDDLRSWPDGQYYTDTWINGTYRGSYDGSADPASDSGWKPKDPDKELENDDGIAFFYSFPRRPATYTISVGGYCAFQKWSGSDHVASFQQSGSITIPALENYKIAFDYNGGEGKTKTITKYYGLSDKFPTPNKRTNYTFLGWKENGSTKLYKAGDPLTKNGSATYVAQWKQNHTPPTIRSSSIIRGTYDKIENKWTNDSDGEYFKVELNSVQFQAGYTLVSAVVDSGNSDDAIVESASINESINQDNTLMNIARVYKMATNDRHGSRRVSVSVSDSLTTTSVTLLLSAAAYALHIVGTPGTDSFGLSVNGSATNGEIKLYSSKGITYNDGPVTLYEGEPIVGAADGTGKILKGNINKYIAIDLFCSDEEGHQFTQRFIREGETWDSKSRYLLYCIYANPDTPAQYIKSEVIAMFYHEPDDKSYIKIKEEACVGSITDGTIKKSTDYDNWYIKINKIVGHTTLLGLTTVDGGTGSGGHEYFAGYGLKLVGRTFNADVAKADLDKVDNKINSIPITFIEGM